MATRRRCCRPTRPSAIGELTERSNRYARWATREGTRKGRHRLPADAEPAGIHGDLARHHARRRRGGAAQHQSDRAGAGALHQRRHAEACDRGGRTAGQFDSARAASDGDADRSGCMATRRRSQPRIDPRGRRPVRRRAPGSRASRAHHRGPRALHLHLRHHRPAEGGEHQPLPRDARQLRLCRRHGHARQRPHVRSACRCTTPPAASVAIGSLLVAGGSVYIREQFSAREFWDDIVHNDCTLFQYIGELCRYLVNSPPQPNETQRTRCGSPAATACGPTSGRSSSPASAFRRSSNSTPRPKATC